MTEQTNKFNFEHVGRRMPYKVPDGFFDQLVEQTIEKASAIQQKKRISPLRRYARALYTVATAAVLAAMIFSISALRPHPTATPRETTIEEAFSNLSAADQDYILDTFMNDMIIDY